MSEIRCPDEIITRRLPKKDGTSSPKRVKYELFLARQFALHWTPLVKGRFAPEPPLRTSARAEYWATMYRLRINGKWYGETKYTMLTHEQIMELIMGVGLCVRY